MDRVLAHGPIDPLNESPGEKQRDDAEGNCRNRSRRPSSLAVDVAKRKREVAQMDTKHNSEMVPRGLAQCRRAASAPADVCMLC